MTQSLMLTKTLATLDSDSRHLLTDILPNYSPHAGMSAHEMRTLALALARKVQGPPPEVARVFDTIVENGDYAVALRVYNPAPEKRPGCLVWLHGGGFVTGGLDAHDILCRRLAAGSGQAVVSVDYRLAPEHPFPAALNDSYAALAWVARSAEVIGMRLGALAVGGSSAGANLAAAACLMAREAGGPAIIRQVLVYPVLDAEMSHPSYLTCGNGYQLTAAMMAAYIDAYAPNGTDRTNPLLSPLHAPSLAGLPPAHIVVADCDPLHDEVCAYAVKLKRNGVAVIQSNFIGVMHGFFGQAGVLSQARVAQKAVCDDLAEHLQSSD